MASSQGAAQVHTSSTFCVTTGRIRPRSRGSTSSSFPSPEGLMLNPTQRPPTCPRLGAQGCRAAPERSACTTFATAATLWLAAGESIYFVQQQLGHADIQTTIDQYGHPDKQAHREAAPRAASWWREAASE